jgi:uncharacterized surface protein with fasciclin (FAS1) repeats
MKKLMTIAIAIVMVFAVAGITKADCSASHKSSKETATNASTKLTAKMDIVETAVSAGNFTTLVAAVKAAGLVDVLKGDGPFTVFAPTDEAFAKLPKGTVEGLLKDTDKLSAILTYHVVSGKVTAADVVKLDKAATVNGQTVKITASDNGVMVDNANVVKTDIVCSNGVIHVIDQVILPKEDK